MKRSHSPPPPESRPPPENGIRPDNQLPLITLDELDEGINGIAVDDIELVIIRHNEEISVFGSRCLHMGESLIQGYLEGEHLTCSRHRWRYHIKTGVLEGEPTLGLKKLSITMEDRTILIDLAELDALAPEDDE